jgi:uncharacterized membrane protein YccC
MQPYRAWFALLLALTCFHAQAQEEFDAAIQDIDNMFTAVNDFVEGVRFSEKDVESLIEHWAEFNAIGEEYEDDDEGSIDFDGILSDPTYRDWADSQSFDAEDWLRKAVRISMVLFREQMLSSAEMFPQQMQQQMEMIEQQRDHVDEEMYLQMKQAMEDSARYAEQLRESAERLVQPTAAETSALEQYRDTLMALMADDDEEEDFGYDEYAEDEDYPADDAEGW